MQRFYSSFPDGRAGLGLLLLRVAAGVSIVIHARTWVMPPTSPMIAVSLSALAVALLLLIGFMTPIAGALAAAGGLFGASPANLYLSVIAAAIVLLGPGAFSLDARLFGRRQILF